MTTTTETKRNAAGEHVYHCSDCGQECTVGTPGGPATQDVHGVTRCWKCNRIAEEKRARLNAAATEMAEALREVRPILEALQAAHPLPDHDSAVGHGKALRLVRAALAKAVQP